ncbi:hypothetical protein [[Clostridium] scindens]|uniref:DUF4376 domain-containing protein n=1 Tax=Clostridium scindens (strain JCM 10418 / VPI 12708) TaxID=29347 RepID=UPI00156EF638|nr:hypothetical protein [[Clostridium] scindens]NSI89817.1 hypothetical protein [[Clostridium] scindens]NSJ05002.1 hypothetical protein [[Clostridium] scindens]
MQNVLFLNTETPSKAEVKRLGEHLIQIIGDVEKNTSGFHLINDVGSVYGKYEDFTTLYKEIEGGFVLSDDGSVYVEPEPVPEPEPYEPSLEEVQEAKVQEMNGAQQAAIQEGINVKLTDGAVEHFTLTDHDQTSLVGLQAKVLEGEDSIPWHTSDEAEHCKFYSNADMALITTAAMEYVTWHVTYFRDLRIYIRSLKEKTEVEVVTYGMTIPEAYQSEPLKAMIAAQAI